MAAQLLKLNILGLLNGLKIQKQDFVAHNFNFITEIT